MKLWLMSGVLLMLAACSSVTKEDLGLANNSPDERLVEERAPLSLPPEFNIRPNVPDAE